MKRFLLYLWQLPQNLLGLLFLLFTRGEKKHYLNGYIGCCRRHPEGYHHFYTEKWADSLGGVKR